jgi:hypothetical protein
MYRLGEGRSSTDPNGVKHDAGDRLQSADPGAQVVARKKKARQDVALKTNHQRRMEECTEAVSLSA